MTGLQEAFYIMAIVFMSLVFLILILILIAILKIRAKINRIHENIESKINSVTSIAEKSGELAAIASSQVIKRAKKTIRKTKK